MIVAGIGCRRGASAAEIEAAIAAALGAAGIAREALSVIATSSAKSGEPGIAAAASARGLKLIAIPQPEMELAAANTVTRSDRVMSIAGVPSVSEAAALAAGGPGARLLVPRTAVGGATCALASSGDQP